MFFLIVNEPEIWFLLIYLSKNGTIWSSFRFIYKNKSKSKSKQMYQCTQINITRIFIKCILTEYT